MLQTVIIRPLRQIVLLSSPSTSEPSGSSVKPSNNSAELGVLNDCLQELLDGIQEDFYALVDWAFRLDPLNCIAMHGITDRYLSGQKAEVAGYVHVYPDSNEPNYLLSDNVERYISSLGFSAKAKFTEKLEQLHAAYQKMGNKCQLMEQEIENLTKDKQELQEIFAEKSISRQKTKLDEMYDQLRTNTLKCSVSQPARNLFPRAQPDLFPGIPNIMDSSKHLRQGCRIGLEDLSGHLNNAVFAPLVFGQCGSRLRNLILLGFKLLLVPFMSVL